MQSESQREKRAVLIKPGDLLVLSIPDLQMEDYEFEGLHRLFDKMSLHGVIVDRDVSFTTRESRQKWISRHAGRPRNR